MSTDTAFSALNTYAEATLGYPVNLDNGPTAMRGLLTDLQGLARQHGQVEAFNASCRTLGGAGVSEGTVPEAAAVPAEDVQAGRLTVDVMLASLREAMPAGSEIRLTK